MTAILHDFPAPAKPITGAHVLRLHREAAGVSMKHLAARAGFSPSYISRLEAGSRTPTRAVLHKLAGELCLDADHTNGLFLAYGYAPDASILGEITDLLTNCEDAGRYTRGLYLLGVVRDALTGRMP